MRHLLIPALFATALAAVAQTSPDGQLNVTVKCEQGKPTYSVTLGGQPVLLSSPLGLNTSVGDLTQGLTLAKTSEVKAIEADYTLYNIKQGATHYAANEQTYTFSQKQRVGKRGEEKTIDVEVLTVTFRVSNNNLAFRYQLLPQRDILSCTIDDEATGYTFPDGTTTFLCPQMGEMTGFARTAPSYETHYDADAPMGKNGWGTGYTFPCLFKAPYQSAEAWLLLSETGTQGDYPGCKIENIKGGEYQISFPSIKENNGYGSPNAQLPLPCATPWRTLTVADNLKPIVESTITWDVLATEDDAMKQADRQRFAERYGRGAWSWIIANDESCNYDTQKQYIDFAAAMGWQSLLVDAMWDTQIGRDRIAELAQYGKEKGVYLYLWYNSNGVWNDAPQGPKNCMDTYQHRRQEMEWMQRIGIRGIKVDFFGGDKQCTMQLYHDILTDAYEHDIMVIFHGCTLPRGWEALYPNYVASEAVRASENLHFGQNECDREAMDATFLPFIRNVVGSMDFGGSTLNWYYNPKNSNEMWGGHRVTSDVFALATALLFQSPVQHFAMAPNNLTDAPAWAVDFMKTVPTTWTETRFIAGYPGKYIVMARRSSEGKWYVTAVNGTKEPIEIHATLDMFQPKQTVTLYSDDAKLQGSKKPLKLNAKRQVKLNIPVNGGLVIEPSPDPSRKGRGVVTTLID